MKKTCIHFDCQREDVGYSAKAVGFPIVTQGDTFEELEQNIKEAIALHFEDEANIGELSYNILIAETAVVINA